MYIHISDDAQLVNHENRPLAGAFRPKDAVGFGYLSMGIKVTEKGIGYASQIFRPGSQAGNAVYTETQHLGLDPFKPVKNSLVGRDLARSDRRKSQREKGQNDVLFVAIVAYPDRSPKMAVQA
jgi:hypothetical protein